MTRYIVVSDSHGAYTKFARIIERHPEATGFLFLGDKVRDAEDAEALYPDKMIISVRGNCDLFSDLPSCRVIKTKAGPFFMTHGHEFGADEERILKAARENGAVAALYGHTHISSCHFSEGTWIVNPGSISQPRAGNASYAVIDILDNGDITAHIAEA